MSGRPTVAVMVERIGPYHAARLRALGEAVGPDRCLALELAAQSREYGWDPVEAQGFRRRTLITHADYKDTTPATRSARVVAALERERPDAVAINGWAFAESAAALAWCRLRGRVAVLMSESQERDAARSALAEGLKRQLVSRFDAALVGGECHARYLARLGLPRERVALGYDVVDNAYFAAGAARARAEPGLAGRLGLPERFFLCSCRFIEKKNLLTLLEAYALYLRRSQGAPWSLVMLGDGPLRPRIEDRVRALDLGERVRLPGFRQYDELPSYYGLASAFVLPSTSEQWGLVVNEAMAAGLPVLVSEACGSAELVRDGESGYRFPPEPPEALAERMRLLASDPAALARMGEGARAAVAAYEPGRFAAGMLQAVQAGQARVRARGRFPGAAP